MSELESKKLVVKELTDRFKKSKGIYLAFSQGIDSNTMTVMRKTCRESGIKYFTAKNKLAKRALNEIGIKSFDKDLNGPVTIAVSYKDGMVPAKVLSGFAKDSKDKFVLKGCIVDGVYFAGKDVAKLADVPSREVLLSQLACVLNAPMANLASALSSIITKFACAIDAVAKKKAAE